LKYLYVGRAMVVQHDLFAGARGSDGETRVCGALILAEVIRFPDLPGSRKWIRDPYASSTTSSRSRQAEPAWGCGGFELAFRPRTLCSEDTTQEHSTLKIKASISHRHLPRERPICHPRRGRSFPLLCRRSCQLDSLDPKLSLQFHPHQSS